MALQKTKTNTWGLEVDYWRVKDINIHYDDTWTNAPTGHLFRFTVEGYHDSSYRDNDAGVESHQYIVTGDHLTNIINSTSGDLRPGIYDWLKSGAAAGALAPSNVGADSKLDNNFFADASDA